MGSPPVVVALSYDAAGGLTNVSTVGSLAYDARHRVGQATIGALVTSYGVNALGQRVAKNGPASGQVEYVYDLSGRLLGAYGANGAAQEEIVWLGSLPVATLHGGAVYYIAPDHLGAPHQIVNSANQQVWFWDHDPFGEGAPAAAAGFAHNLRFPGQIFDPETGLCNNGFRDYSPALGRYVESDPIGLAGGVNTYAYAGNNPVSFADPFGLSADTQADAAGFTNNFIAAIVGIGHNGGPALEEGLNVLRAAALAPFLLLSGDTCDTCDIWSKDPTLRGRLIEYIVAQTEYRDWFWVGSQNRGYFGLVDFQQGGALVSLKSVDTRGSSWLDGMQAHIVDLATRGATVNGVDATMSLDLRVQPGGAAAAQPLVDFGAEQGVSVTVKEFP